MTEISSDEPRKPEIPSKKEYEQIGAKLFKIIREVETNTYVYDIKKELFLLQTVIIFDELIQARIKQAQVAENDLSQKNLEDFDPEEVIKSASKQYQGKSKRTPEDEAEMWGKIFYVRPLWAIDKALETFKLVQERGLGKLPPALLDWLNSKNN